MTCFSVVRCGNLGIMMRIHYLKATAWNMAMGSDMQHIGNRSARRFCLVRSPKANPPITHLSVDNWDWRLPQTPLSADWDSNSLNMNGTAREKASVWAGNPITGVSGTQSNVIWDHSFGRATVERFTGRSFHVCRTVWDLVGVFASE